MGEARRRSDKDDQLFAAAIERAAKPDAEHAARRAARVPRQPPTTAPITRAQTAKEHRAKERQRGQVLDYLAKLQEGKAEIDRQMTAHIELADQLGVSRVDIARSLGISRQAVQQRLKAPREDAN